MKIFKWSLKDEMGWLMFWAIGIAGFVTFVIFLYPLVGEVLRSFLDKEAITKAFMGRYALQMLERSYFDVWLSMEFFAWFGVLLAIYPLIYASNSITREVRDRSLEILLAQPVSRSRVLIEKFLALIVNLAVLCAVGFLALVLAATLWVDESASFVGYSYIFINNFMLLFTIAAFGFFCSVLINDQRAALSLTFGAVMGSFLVYKVLSGVGVALWLTYLTPYRYADATKVLAMGRFNWGDNIVLAIAGAALLTGAVAFFERKDIAS